MKKIVFNVENPVKHVILMKNVYLVNLFKKKMSVMIVFILINLLFKVVVNLYVEMD